MQSTTAMKDPVCGMNVEAAKAAARSEYNGQTYHFCCFKCKEKFDLNPDQYLAESAGTAKGSCCCG